MTTDTGRLRELAKAAPIPGLETVAWTLTRTLEDRETTHRACLWFTDPVNSAWSALVTRTSAESALRALQEERDAALAECERLRAVMCEALTWVQAAHRDKPFNDPDICGEMVPVRVTGLAMLAEEVRPGCRAAAMQAWFEAARTSQGTP